MALNHRIHSARQYRQFLSSICLIALFSSCAADQEFAETKAKQANQDLTADDGPLVRQLGEIEQLEGTKKIPIDSLYDSGFLSGTSTVIPRNVGDQNFWVAVREYQTGNSTLLPTSSAHFYKLQGGKLISKKTWTGLDSPGAGGTRIFVLEGGSAVFAKQGGLVYFLNEQLPEGNLAQSPDLIKYQLNNARASDRACAVSYQKGGVRMVGIGYGAGYFAEIPLGAEPPYKPDLDKVSYSQPFPSGQWGYSCFLDSVKLVYYSQSGANTFALSLEDLSPSFVYQNANNAGFESQNASEITSGLALVPFPGEQTSYAMAGDRLGNIYNGGANYTVTHEAVSNTLWATDKNGNASTAMLRIYPHECGSTKKVCEGHRSFSYKQDLNMDAPIQPVSALGGGYVVGISRNSGNHYKNGDIYLLSLNDVNDIAKGVKAELLDSLPDADPYMYTDFTGATLYKSLTKNEVDLSKIEGWDLDKDLRRLYFSFDVISGKSISWKNISAKIRCYKDGANKPDFEPVAMDIKPLEQQKLVLKSCQSKEVRFIEIELSALNSSPDLNYIHKLQFAAFQRQ